LYASVIGLHRQLFQPLLHNFLGLLGFWGVVTHRCLIPRHDRVQKTFSLLCKIFQKFKCGGHAIFTVLQCEHSGHPSRTQLFVTKFLRHSIKRRLCNARKCRRSFHTCSSIFYTSLSPTPCLICIVLQSLRGSFTDGRW